MKTKTAKKSKATDRKKTKKSRKKTVKKELNPGQVLEDISAVVEAQAQELLDAVIGEGMKGQVSPVKYLFEMAHIYPQAPEPVAPSKDEECLAETLLHRLNLPKTPVVHDELQKEEDEESAGGQLKNEAQSEEKSDEEEQEREEKPVTVH